MGVNLVIYVHKNDLKKILDLDSDFMDWHDFIFLVDFAVIRWHTFEKIFDLENYTEKDVYEEGITSKELLIHMARTNKNIKDREVWARILSEYNLLFAPDTKEDIGKEWIDLDYLFDAIKILVKKRFDELIEIYKKRCSK